MMLNNILVLFGCVVLLALLWLAYQFLGQYMFLLMFVITFALLIRGRKPKFGAKK
jgi:hypothetical protein